MAKKGSAGFPEQLVVQRETDDTDDSFWFNASSEGVAPFDTGVIVGIYKLVDVKEVKVTKELV